MANGQERKRLFDRRKNRQANFRSRWEMMAPYVSPTRFGITSGDQNRADGQSMGNRYDSTGMFAADILSNFITGEIINPAEQWGKNVHGNPELRSDDEVKEWLDECTERQLRDFSRSNFYTEAPEAISDVVGFGTGQLFFAEKAFDKARPQQGWRGTRFQCDRIGRFYPEVNASGEIDSTMREFVYTARNAYERWGDKCPQNILAVREKEPDKQFTFVHDIYPRPYGERNGAKGSKTAMPWASCYFEYESAEIVEETGFNQFPCADPRWKVVPGEIEGRGPGELALNDILTVDATKRLSLESLALSVHPLVITRHDSVVGTLNFKPWGVSTVRAAPGGRLDDSIRTLDITGRPEVTQLEVADIRQAIRQAFYVDQILKMLEIDKAEMTAYEFRQKMILLFRLLGPIYGRMHREFLQPVWESHFTMMYLAGQLPPPPPILAEYEDGGQVDVDFDNPLSRAQKSGDIESMNMALGDLAPLIEAEMKIKGYSEALDWVDTDKWTKRIFDVRGAPATVVRSDKEVEQLRQARAQAQAAERQQQEGMMMAEGMQKAAPMMKVLAGGKQAA